jgi:hypothetical protein
MILAALALLAPITDQQILFPQRDNPTAADKMTLMQAAAKCGLHAGAAYFIQYNVPREPVIHITRGLGDTDEQALCVLQNLPSDFSFRFGLDVEAPPKD